MVILILKLGILFLTYCEKFIIKNELILKKKLEEDQRLRKYFFHVKQKNPKRTIRK